METKVCTICQKELPIEDFNWRDKKKGTRRSECKYCHTKYMQDRIAKKREYASQVKEQLGCAKCGETRPYVLDFHHLDPTEKENTVSRLISNTSNIEKAQKVYDTYNEGTYVPTKANVNTLKSNYDASSLEAQKAIVSELEKQVASLEENQKKLGQANEQKKALQAQLDKTTNALTDANSKLQEAQKKYDALLNGTSEEEISKDVEEKEKALAEAQKELEEAQNTVADLTQQKAEVEAKVTEATQNVESAKNAYVEAQMSVNEAQKALDTAVANYKEKKAIYDGASDPTIKAQYEADIKNAENELVTAQTNLQVALENQTAKANAVTSAEKGLADVNQEILNLDAQIAEKQKALDVLNQTINDAETALNEAKAQLETAKANQATKEKELETAKANLEKAKQDAATQQSKVNEAQDAVTAQEKVVTQLRTDKEQAQAKIEQGSKGFFEAYGYTDALKILEEQSTANGGSTLIIKCLTDNSNRTISFLKTAFNKGGAKMASQGAVSYMYDHLGVVGIKGHTEDEIMDALINADVDANINQNSNKDLNEEKNADEKDLERPFFKIFNCYLNS